MPDTLLAYPALALVASTLFSLGAWTRALGVEQRARASAAGLWLVLSLPVVYALGDAWHGDWFAGASLAGASAWALLAGWQLLKTSPGREDARLAARERRVGYALCAAPAVFAPFASFLFEPQWGAATTVFVVVLLLASWICFALGHRHAARGDRGRAALARFAGLWASSALVLPIGAVTGTGFTPALVACASFPLAAPFVLRRLLGKGPVPLDLQPTTAAGAPPSRPTRLAPVALLGLLASAGLLFELSLHYPTCAGVLEAVKAPENWRDLPEVAQGSGADLGPFKLRAYHFDYKGYPSAYGGASLGDPGLCFASGIDLSSWFDGDEQNLAMYRSPDQLRLRREPGSPTFVVSASQGEETLLAAFERRLGARRMFDSDVAHASILLGAILLSIGCVALFFGWQLAARDRERAASMARRVALLAFLSTLLAFASLERTWRSDSSPRPGRELAVEHSWII
jgi:hypothetical protein